MLDHLGSLAERISTLSDSLPEWKQAIVGFVQSIILETIDHLSLLTDGGRLNRRTRAALKAGRSTRASYLAVKHHQRRLARRREIRRLVEGPVGKNCQ
jgi:hypothetical protein